MPTQAPEFGTIVPQGWNNDTILTLLKRHPNLLKWTVVAETGEIIIYSGYKLREDGCLEKLKSK